MRVTRTFIFAVFSIAMLLSFSLTASAQNNPYGPPSDQVYFDYSNTVVNYSSNTTVGPPSWNYFPIRVRGAGS